MPAEQPFIVPRELAVACGWHIDPSGLSAELRDSFELYGLHETETIAWFDRAQARTLPAVIRKRQPARHRWPTANTLRDQARVAGYVAAGRRPSRHAEVPARHWEAIHHILPGARGLVGRFPAGSGPNCFGTVMAAVGVKEAGEQWLQIAAFEEWLRAAASPGGAEQDPGVLLIWRDTAGTPTHAAVTLGGGWLLHKPSQGWMSPTKVLTVTEGKYSARQRDRRLTRYRLS